MTKRNACAVAVALALAGAQAFAANVSASMAVAQSDGSTWVEDLTGLVATDAQNNFSMVQGSSANAYFQNGVFSSSVPTTSDPDYWQWAAGVGSSAGSWSWHTASVVDATQSFSAANPWQSAVKLQNLAGHGDPDMIYAVSAINNNALTQTYTFTFGEAITPTVSGTNSTYADVAGSLTSRSGNGSGAMIAPVSAGGVQLFELSADGGSSFVNAGVDVGQAATVLGTGAYGTYAASNANGPTGQTWNYMRLVSTFSLSGKSAASLVGFASVSPVPEAPTSAMLLLGIGLIGTIVRRRRNMWS